MKTRSFVVELSRKRFAYVSAVSVRNEYGSDSFGSSKSYGPIEASASTRTSNGFSGAPPSQNPWKAAYPDSRRQGRQHSHVVYGRVSRFQWSGSGNASIKTVFSGHANIHSDGSVHRVEPSSYLVVNHGREYSFLLQEPEPVDGLSLFFEPEMVTSAVRARRRRHEMELDTPKPTRRESVEFFERIFQGDAVWNQLARMHDEIPHFHSDPMWVQENLHQTMNLMLDRHAEAKREVESVNAVRQTTREELYRRLYKARDYAYATLDQPVSLDDLAYVACLSTNYFLRSFRGLFRQTPHQFIIEKRIHRARSLLTESNASVSDVCLAVGFQSLGSFSWLFKKRTGLSPEAYRRASVPISY